ncbi:MAG: neutral/alkaline non-lysosomal ceramidase N-terminal domain-containing protein, partial [Bacteroidota bacterium]
MNLWLKVLLTFLSTLLAVVLVLVGEIPRDPFVGSDYYLRMHGRLDSLEQNWHLKATSDSLRVGWSRTALIPDRPVPMAGYGARDPKEFDGITDTVYVRTIVLDDGEDRVAWLSADLLVIHPEVAQAFFEKASDLGWERGQLYLSATHTHASIGAWAPGLVGKLFAGPYDPSIVEFVANRMLQSLTLAESQLQSGSFAYGELKVPELIKNRLVKERGTTDPWLKVIGLTSGEDQAYASVYAAHATSLSHHHRALSGGFPGSYNRHVVSSTEATFSLYAAGAVGSMGPRVAPAATELLETDHFAMQLSENVALLELLDPPYQEQVTLAAFRLPLDLPDPMMKINRSHGLRTWLFERLTG